MVDQLNKRINDLEDEIKWYKNTYEKRKLIGIIKDRIFSKARKFFFNNKFKNKIKFRNNDLIVSKILSNYLNPSLKVNPNRESSFQETATPTPTLSSVDVSPSVLKVPVEEILSPKVDFEEIITNYPKNKQEKSINFKQIKHFFLKRNQLPKQSKYTKTVDIIVPIYNGLHFLEVLIPQILKNSDLPYHLILINDCSPDVKIIPFLEKYGSMEHITIVNNEKNLGFTGSVNKALAMCKHDVVILNTDTEVPSNWLSRLFNPIFADAGIASVTPFSNCATIASFPKYDDNDIFENLHVEKLDYIFKSAVEALPIEIPTGVGFCMALSRVALDKIGVLDEENFPKGYGEEVDWCRRAKKNGFKNVHIPNLFVYHKHGGSFSAETKKALSSDHQLRLEAIHPDFMPDVHRFFENSIQNSVRQFLLLRTINEISPKTLVYFDHELGGGSNLYTENFITDNKDQNLVVCITYIHPLHNPNNKYAIRFYYKEYSNIFNVDSLENLYDFFKYIKVDELIVGSLITHELLKEIIDMIKKIRNEQKCYTTYLMHDYHSICPQFTLMYQGNKFCNIPDYGTCETCKVRENVHPVLLNKDYSTLPGYRLMWEKFLKEDVDQIVCFAESVKRLILKTYPSMNESKIATIPHKVSEFRPINVAVIGNIHSKSKGGEIILEMAQILEKTNNPHNVRIIILGDLSPEFSHVAIQKSGSYHRQNLYDLIRKNYIDVILIPSIWPETFSYTTAEAIISNLPVFSFDLGGQADQVKNYKKGHIINEMNAGTVIKRIIHFVHGEWLKTINKENGVDPREN